MKLVSSSRQVVAAAVGVVLAGAALAFVLAAPVAPQPVQLVAVATSPAPVPSPTPAASPSASPAATQAPAPSAAPVQVAPPAAQPSAAPAPAPPTAAPTAPPTAPPATVHSVSWNDPTPGIDPAVGGWMLGPTVVGSGLEAAQVTGTFTCSAVPGPGGFQVGIRDVTTAANNLPWNGFDTTGGQAYYAIPARDTAGDTYQLVVEFTDPVVNGVPVVVTCDWTLTMSA